jgi:hypothetical protein
MGEHKPPALEVPAANDLGEHLAERRKVLQADFETTEAMLHELDERRAVLRDHLLRLSGALQVLDEELQGISGTGGSEERHTEIDNQV